MSFYNVTTARAPLGFEVTIRCLYGSLRAVVELAEEIRAQPDAERVAIALLAERHDQVCAHRCVDALKIADHDYSTIVPEVNLEIGNASVGIQARKGPGSMTRLHVVLTCPHKTSEMIGDVMPGAAQLDAQMELLMDAGRKHRALTDCGCVPDPDDAREWE